MNLKHKGGVTIRRQLGEADEAGGKDSVITESCWPEERTINSPLEEAASCREGGKGSKEVFSRRQCFKQFLVRTPVAWSWIKA